MLSLYFNASEIGMQLSFLHTSLELVERESDNRELVDSKSQMIEINVSFL